MPCQFLNQRPLAGTGQNLRAVRLLDFFDRCAIPCSLYHPPDAVAGDAFGTLRSLVSDKKKALDHWDGQGFLVVAEAGFEPTTFGL